MTVNSIKFDSIQNLPSGLCWSTNAIGDSFSSGQTGVIYISGTTNANSGQYKLNIKVDITINAIITLRNQDLEVLSARAGQATRYFLRVKNPTDNCPAIDTNAIGASSSAISVTTLHNNPVICNGQPITLCPSYTCASCTYSWTTGDTTQCLPVSVAGYYGVRVTDGSAVYTAPALHVLADTVIANFALVQDSLMPYRWFVINNTRSTFGGSYYWTWGDGSTDTVYYPSHIYSSAIPHTVGLVLSDPLHQCSSNEYHVAMPAVTPFPATVTVTSSSSTICNSHPITLYASYCTGCHYTWSTGDTTESISVSGVGPYTVIVSDSAHTGSASSSTLTADAVTANYSLAPDTTTPHQWIVYNNCIGTGPLQYLWT